MTRFSSPRPTTRADSGVARHFKGGGGINFQRIFFGRTNLELIKKQESLRGVRGHAPPEKF